MDPLALQAHQRTRSHTERTENLFIQTAVVELFSDPLHVDVVFLQEVDLPMWGGLMKLEGQKGPDGKKLYTVKAINSETQFLRKLDDGKIKFEIVNTKKNGTIGISEYLQQTYSLNRHKVKGWGKPGTDWTYVVAKSPTTVTCTHQTWVQPTYTKKNKQEEFDMSKIGYCTVVKDGLSVNVLAMHGDGDKGFTPEQAEAVKTQMGPSLDFVLGDMNIDTPKKVEKSVQPLGGAFSTPDGTLKTVFRRIHPYRKIIQNFQNSGKTSLGKVESEFESTEKVIWFTQESFRLNYKEKWTRQGIITFLQNRHNAYMEQEKTKMLPNKWYAIIDPDMFAVGKIITELFDMMINDFEIYEGLLKMNEKRNFEGLLGLLGMKSDLMMDTDAAVWSTWEPKLKTDVKREDWIVFNTKTMKDKQYRFKTEIVPGEATLKNITEAKGLFPTTAWPSDHLPVILKFEHDSALNVKRMLSATARKVKRIALRRRATNRFEASD